MPFMTKELADYKEAINAQREARNGTEEEKRQARTKMNEFLNRTLHAHPTEYNTLNEVSYALICATGIER